MLGGAKMNARSAQRDLLRFRSCSLGRVLAAGLAMAALGFAVPALSQTINTVAGGGAGDGGAATSASLSAGGVALGISQAQSGPVGLRSATKWTRRCPASRCPRAPTVPIGKAASQGEP